MVANMAMVIKTEDRDIDSCLECRLCSARPYDDIAMAHGDGETGFDEQRVADPRGPTNKYCPLLIDVCYRLDKQMRQFKGAEWGTCRQSTI